MKFSPFFAAATLVALGGAITAPVRASDPAAVVPAPKSPLDFTMKDIDGKPVDLSTYKGNVVLIVNTASKCGYTPQYASLESLYGKYKDKGLKILAFPANDFMHQEPGTEAEIKQFCSLRYKTTFDLFSKVVTKGDGQSALYSYLTSKDPDPKNSGDIKWNFTKFLIGRDGRIIKRFEPIVDPMSAQFTVSVEDALAEPQPEAPAAAAK